MLGRLSQPRLQGLADGYFCPAFDRSPVENSFNPTICVMPGSCASREPGQDEPPPPEPGSEPVAAPAGFFPPTPDKIPELIGAAFEAGATFAKDLTDVIVGFVGSVGKLVV